MPLYFIPNDGQMDEPVAFYVQGKDKTLYFTPEGITLVLTNQPCDPRPAIRPLSRADPLRDLRTETDRID